MSRRWGQHFLRSSAVVERILEASEIQSHEQVLEIGPGEGVLTQGLCERAHVVHAFEIDRNLACRLERWELGNLKIHQGDFLRGDLGGDWANGSWAVVANLPYYITAPILNRLFWERPIFLSRAVLMMQDEVARRLCGVATRNAGAISYIVGAFHRVEYLFKVGPKSFAPPPKVDSAVVRVTPTLSVDAALAVDPLLTTRYEQLVSRSFTQRRKQLGRSLRDLPGWSDKAFFEAGIDPVRRPETLRVEEFWALARSWSPSV